MIDSYGYQVMSLDEVIEALTDIKARYPFMGQQPCWVAGRDLHRPVKNVLLLPGAPPRLMVEVEHG